MVIIWRPLLLTLLLLPLASPAAEPTTAPTTNPVTSIVEMLILDPLGRPRAHAAVRLSPHVTSMTDDHGIAQFNWGLGKSQIAVDVPGVGYGSTGVIIVAAGQTTKAALPRLVPYATVTGEVPNGAGAFIALVDDGGKHGQPIATADANGHFTCELEDGDWRLVALRGNSVIAQPLHDIVLRPGDRIDPLRFFEVPPKPKQPEKSVPTTQYEFNQPPKHSVPWAHGTVRDSAGGPVNGATVYGAVFFSDGHGSAMAALAAKTDRQGRYEIHGPDCFGDSVTMMVVATKAGLPPATSGRQFLSVVWENRANYSVQRAIFPTGPIDIAMAPRGGQLDVAVSLAGHAVPGATVSAENADWPFIDFIDDPWARPVLNNDAIQVGYTLDAFFSLSAKTGADGTAHFQTLLPGRYNIGVKTDAIPNSIVRDDAWISTPVPIGHATGVVVQTGRTTTQRVEMYDWPMPVRDFRVFRHDGSPLVGKWGFAEGSPESTDEGSNEQITCDANGLAQRQISDVGLRRISFIYPITPECQYSEYQFTVLPPYYAATAFIGVSPRLIPFAPVRIAAQRVNAANVFVQLLDPAGKPIRGFVKIGGTNVGTTDAQGRLVFEQVPTWFDFSNQIEAWAADPQLRDPLMPDPAPPPSDAQLRNRIFFRTRQVKIPPTGNVHFTLQAEPAGYIVGKISPPAGSRPSDYSVATSDADSTVNYDPSSGRFVAGPFAAGTHGVSVSPVKGDAVPVESKFDIQAGRVAALAGPIHLRAHPQAAPDFEPAPPPVAVHIFEQDDKTPAYGAILRSIDPDAPWDPQVAAMEPETPAFSDASGNVWFQWPPDTLTPPTRELLIAIQPGIRGATVVDIAHAKALPSSVTLPPPISAIGNVTLAGKPLTGQIGTFYVLASFQDRTGVHHLFDVIVTPQPDGTFELAGLTPGTYKVQASLDKIWLSDSVTITASAGKPLPAIHLDIPQPGGPAMVRVTSAKGKPLVGVQVMVDRPAGPLTDVDWPASFTSDGAGDVWIPALEAGKHTVRFADGAGSVDFTVPPLPAKAAVEVKLTEH